MRWKRGRALASAVNRPGGELTMATHRTARRRSTATSSRQFVFRAVDEVGATLNAALVVMGDKLGLYRALAGAGPLTPAELAERTGTAERYVREWLNAQAAGGYVEYDPADRPLHAAARAGHGADRRDEPGVPARASSRSRSARCSTRRASPRPSAPATASAGTTTSTTCIEGCERFFRPGYNANLDRALAAGARRRRREARARRASVADVGCGHGASTILMAQAFPNSTFVGSDYHDGSIATARERGRGGRRRRPRQRSRSRPRRRTPGTGYDLVTMFDCLHDMGDPVGAARHVRATLAADGTWMIVEPVAGDRVEDNLNPVGRAYYGVLDAALHARVAVAGGRARARRPGGRGAHPRRRHGRRVHPLPPRRRDAVQPRLRGAAVSRRSPGAAADPCAPDERGLRRARRRPRALGAFGRRRARRSCCLPTWSIVALAASGRPGRPTSPATTASSTFDGRGNGRSDRPHEPAAYADARVRRRRARGARRDRTPSAAVLVGRSSAARAGARCSPPTTPSASTASSFIAPARADQPSADRSRRSTTSLDIDEGWAKYNAHYWRARLPRLPRVLLRRRCSPSRTRRSRSRTASAGRSRRPPRRLIDEPSAPRISRRERACSRLCSRGAAARCS